MGTLLEVTGNAKPFLKWAGGKSQLIAAIEKCLPKNFNELENLTYIEPFIGSGAVLFWMLKKYPNINRAIINDINQDLYNAYTVIKEYPHRLISELSAIQQEYYQLLFDEDRKKMFLDKRQDFNSRTRPDIVQTALLIFLNRTCFNGLYRVNSKNQFNVPFGKYNNPKICDAETILADSAILQKVTILSGDYSRTIEYATENTFFYFDPPYKPISKTASFNSYSSEVFDDREQIRLREFCETLSNNRFKWLLSNSDPKNIDPEDNFFDDLYKSDSIDVLRVPAKRSINSKASKRGEISELLISNYEKNCF